MSTSWKWPGSRWWRVDFHAHTPKSYDYRPRSAREDPDWVEWVAAARDSGIQAVAITDHNTADAVDPLQKAASEDEHVPVLFPGIELTADDGSHLLLLLDPDSGSQHVEELLSRAGVSVDARGKPQSRSSLSVEQIMDEFGEEALVVGAHLNGPTGILKLTGEQRIAVLRHPGLAAVEINPNKTVEARWLDGSIPEVGRRISQLWSSDSHSSGALGQRFTWVKMTKPNFEGLRLALLDGPGSLKPATREQPGNPNAYSDLALESITVHDGKFMGQSTPLSVGFNPWLNAIIGGRGTGKSTLVDLCRKTLRREAELAGSEGGEEGPLRDYFDRRMSVPTGQADEGLLTEDTVVDVVYRKDGERFLLSWNAKGDSIPIAHLDGQRQTAQEGNVKERFPVRIYSQKQLYALARDPNALLTVIDESPDVRRVELDRSMGQAANHYLSLCASARRARKIAEDLPNRLMELDDIEKKLVVLQEGGQAQVMKEYRLRRQQNDTWQVILRGASQDVETVGTAAEGITVADFNVEVSEDDQAVMSLRREHESLQQTIDRLRQSIRDAVLRARREIEQINNGTDANRWQKAMDDGERAFVTAAAELAETGISDPGQYADLLERAAVLRQEIERLKEESKRATELESQAVSVLAEYRRMRRKLTRRRQHFSEATASEVIRVEVAGYANSLGLGPTIGQTLGTQHYKSDIESIVHRIRGEQENSWDWEGLDQVVTEMRRLHLA